MGSIIVVSEQHHTIPITYNLGEHSLIITNDYGAPDAFELAAPVIRESPDMVASVEEVPTNSTLILDHDESYNLYQCLHTLFHPTQEDAS